MGDTKRDLCRARSFAVWRGRLLLIMALCALALSASCPSTGSPVSGSIRVVGHPMMPVTRRWYWGSCLSEFLLPYQFSGALEGTAIVTERVSREGACRMAPNRVD